MGRREYIRALMQASTSAAATHLVLPDQLRRQFHRRIIVEMKLIVWRRETYGGGSGEVGPTGG